jgi:thioester reductase-like protein
MNYFVTGSTGFIGRHLVEKLLHRKGKIYILVRSGSKDKLKAVVEAWGTHGKRVVPVT